MSPVCARLPSDGRRVYVLTVKKNTEKRHALTFIKDQPKIGRMK